MLFSVIIPLEFHRDKAELCVRSWAREQTLDRSLFEIILAVPSAFPRDELARIRCLLADHDRVIESEAHHDMQLCVEGAAIARGEALFFTESHVWPTPTVLEQCLTCLDQNPGWSAFSCTSVRVTDNLLAVVEADMYEKDIHHGLKEHGWRKILDQCFVTRREPYVRAGGFPAEFGHFAEWVLAARFHALGFRIGFAEHIHLFHQYVGEIGDLRDFTYDFIAGEYAFFSGRERRPGDELLEPSNEWVRRRNWNRRFAWRLAGAALRNVGRAPADGVKSLVRWLVKACTGAGLDRAAALVEAWLAEARLAGAIRFGDLDQVRRWFDRYTVAVIVQRRLRHVAQWNRSQGKGAIEKTVGDANWTPQHDGEVDLAGFHATEILDGRTFQWSEPVALASACVPAGIYYVDIGCCRARGALQHVRVKFFHQGKRLSRDAILICGNTITLRLRVAHDGRSSITWACRALHAPADTRRLGLPVSSIRWRRDPASRNEGRIPI